MKVLIVPTDPSRAVPDPVTGKPVPAEGIEVPSPLSKYWRRRLRDADVMLAPVTARFED